MGVRLSVIAVSFAARYLELSGAHDLVAGGGPCIHSERHPIDPPAVPPGVVNLLGLSMLSKQWTWKDDPDR